MKGFAWDEVKNAKLKTELVPFVEDEQAVFLKTIIPNRKAMRRYLDREAETDET